jgi:hypothetical protein
MRKLDFYAPGVKGGETTTMNPKDKKQVASDRQRRERLKRQLRLLYDDVAREEVPDTLMALVDQIGKAPEPDPEAEAGGIKKEPAPE